jgi:hypothetical protein
VNDALDHVESEKSTNAVVPLEVIDAPESVFPPVVYPDPLATSFVLL